MTTASASLVKASSSAWDDNEHSVKYAVTNQNEINKNVLCTEDMLPVFFDTSPGMTIATSQCPIID